MPSTRSRSISRSIIPYIVISDSEVLHIEEHDKKTMKAVAA